MRKTLSFFSALLILGGLTFYYFSSKPTKLDVRFPVDFVPGSGVPRTLVKIEDNVYRFCIDLGAAHSLSLEKEFLDQLQHKEFLRDSTTTTGLGERHAVKMYRIPLAKVWYLHVRNSEIIERSPMVTFYGSSPSQKEILAEEPGYIGRRFFISTNWFMDFCNAALFACSHLSDRKKDGYCLDELTEIPFKIDNVQGFVLEADTDLGIKKFMLDTGASHNLIKPSVVQDHPVEDWFAQVQRYSSSKFILGGKDFGTTKFVLLEMDPFFGNLDGILGMDFFNEHVVYLDFEKKIAHIGRSDECISGEARDKLRAFQFPLPEGITLNTHP